MDRPTETQLALCSLRVGADEALAARFERLSTSDWDRLIGQSARHGVTSLLYQRIKALASRAAVPANILLTLREMHLHNAARSMRLRHELAQVLTLLQSDGIPVIPLKGAHLVEVVYRDPALRPMSDIDLLVKRPDLSRVESKLRAAGYKPYRPFWPEAEHAVHKHLPPFVKPDAVPLEIHWTIASPASPFRIDVDGLWARARPAVIAGVQVLTLSPEDLLLHLCLHTSYQHRFAVGLKGLYDVYETLRNYRGEIDWEQLRLCARQWGAGKCVYLTLYLARQLVAASVPDDLLSTLEPHDLDARVDRWAQEQIFAERRAALPSSPNLTRIWTASGLRGKMAAFLKFTFPSPQLMATMYPAPPSSKRIYLYYPVRLRDVLLQYGRTAWRLLRRDKETTAFAEREDRGNALQNWLASP